jgi:hypothetical protein
MPKKREYEWYLFSTGNVARTNRILANNLPEENTRQDVLCQDGKVRNLWQCPSGMVMMFWRSRVDLGITFKIFCKALPNGKVRDCTVLFKKDRGSGKRTKQKRKHSKIAQAH